MAIPSVIRKSIVDYLCSIVWIQSYSLQSPLATNPVVNEVSYPPNIGILLPLENYQISKNSEYVDGSDIGQLLCSARISYIVSWVFHRDRYSTFHSLPISQIEDLFCKLTQYLIIYDTAIHEDIISIKVPSQADLFTVPPPDDITTSNSTEASWQIRGKIIIDVQFISDPSEFTPLNFDKIQPPTFDNPDGNPLITFPESVLLKELRIEVNRGEVGYDISNNETFELDEEILIEYPENIRAE